jgi:cell wall-associated NlpC family hydrolase
MTEQEERDRVEEVVRTWVGTPYHDLASKKGAGVDCAMLLREVYVEAGIMEPFPIAHYSPQFFLHGDEERYLSYVMPRGREITEGEVRPGDMALYKIGRVYAHGAIVVKPGWPRIVHAHYAAKCVIEGNGRTPHLGTPVLGVRFFSPWPRGK